MQAKDTEFDRADQRILEVLQEQGNLSAAELAERVGATASTCWRRVTRLEELEPVSRYAVKAAKEVPSSL